MLNWACAFQPINLPAYKYNIGFVFISEMQHLAPGHSFSMIERKISPVNCSL